MKNEIIDIGPGNRPDSTNYMPSIDLRRFVQTLLSEEVAGNKKEAERRTKVDRHRFNYHFKKYPEFRKWFSDQCDAVLGSYEATPTHMLIKKIYSGDTQAVKLYFELRGKLKGSNVNINTAVNNATKGPLVIIRTDPITEEDALRALPTEILETIQMREAILSDDRSDTELPTYALGFLIAAVNKRPQFVQKILNGEITWKDNYPVYHFGK